VSCVLSVVLMGRETGSLQLLAPLLLTGGKGADLVIRGNIVLNKKNLGGVSVSAPERELVIFGIAARVHITISEPRAVPGHASPRHSMGRVHAPYTGCLGRRPCPYGGPVLKPGPFLISPKSKILFSFFSRKKFKISPKNTENSEKYQMTFNLTNHDLPIYSKFSVRSLFCELV
jgi:hypothetical protein